MRLLRLITSRAPEIEVPATVRENLIRAAQAAIMAGVVRISLTEWCDLTEVEREAFVEAQADAGRARGIAAAMAMPEEAQ